MRPNKIRNLARPARRFSFGLYGAGLLAAVWVSPASAKTVQELVGGAEEYILKGNLSAAEIELRNAERQAPQDSQVHLRLAQIYLAMKKGREAEREAKAAGLYGAKEDEYLPVQMAAMLIQGEFDQLLAGILPGTRAPDVESKVRQGRASAYLGLRDQDQALNSFREATEIDPSSLSAKMGLARLFVLKKKVNEADGLVDQILNVNSKLPAALLLKAEILGLRGDLDGALQKVNEVLAIAPKDTSARLYRANIYLSHQDQQSAEKDLDVVFSENKNNAMANYLQAFKLAQLKKFKESNEILTKISASFPDLVDGFYLQGLVQFNLGQLGLAEDNLTKYIARVPDAKNAARLLAVIALRNGAAPRAIGYLKAVLEKTQPDVATLSLLGQAYLLDGKLELAQAQFDAAAELPAEDPQTETRLALSRMNAGQGVQGLAQLESVFSSATGGEVAGPVLVLAELRAGRVDKAAEVVQALVAKDSTNAVYQNLLGLVRVAQKDYSGAETVFKAVVGRDPGFAPATHNLVQVYVATDRRDDAKKACEALLTYKPGDVETLLMLADLAIGDKNWKSAVEYINQARSTQPDDPRFSVKLIDVYLLQQNYQQAQSTVSELLIQFPKNPEVLDAAARTQHATGDLTGAAATYRRAFEAAPNSAAIRSRYIGELIAIKDFKTARDVLEAALASNPPQKVAIQDVLIRMEAEIGGLDAAVSKAQQFAIKDPGNPSYDLVLAELYEKAGRTSNATALLEKWGAKGQTPEPVLLALAGLYLRSDNAEKAITLLEAHLQARPADVDARLILADYRLHQKRLDEARQEYEQIIVNSPRSLVALNNLAWIAQQQGNIAKARELVERAIALAPQNPNTADTLGWIMVAQGDDEGALKYLRTASASSTDPNIRYHLAVALKHIGQTADAKSLLESILASKNNFDSRADAQKLLDDLTKG